MLIKFGDIVGQASGSLRSNTYSHNRFGAYVRNRTIPVNPQSARQTTVRTVLAGLTQAWGNELTQIQRDQWSLYGDNVPVINRLGDSVTLTGLNQYVRSNVPRLISGLARVDDGPIIFSLPETDETAVSAFTVSDQKQGVTFDDTLDWVDQSEAAMLVYAGSPVNPTVNFFNGPFRLTEAILGDDTTAPTSPSALDSPFNFQLNQRIYARYRISLPDGRLSNFFRLSPTESVT